MGVGLIDYNGNPNIGLYAFATDDYCLVPETAPKKFVNQIIKNLEVEVIRLNIAGTPLLGALLISAGKKLFIPKIVLNREVDKLKQLGIKHKIIDSELTALGNNIFVGKKTMLLNPDYDKETRKILEKETGLKTEYLKMDDLKTPGSLIKGNDYGVVMSSLLEQKSRLLRRKLGFENFETTTVNFGNPFISSGIIVNNKGLLLGKTTTGYEAMQIQRALGFTRF